MSARQPRYTIYIPTKGRASRSGCLTARMLEEDGVPFHLVVEPQEEDAYRAAFPTASILVLPFSNLGQGSIPARNWIWEHSLENGDARHWQLDDNLREVRRLYKGKRIPANSGVGLRVCEDFTDRYTNIGISGLSYQMFVLDTQPRPFHLNCHVYSCNLIKNDLPYRWRGRYNEDTDLCLQILSGGYCTVTINAFMVNKMGTMTMKGGNATELYTDDGRLQMARSLERAWPYVVKTSRRFKRPQHVIRDNWSRFTTPLERRSDIDWENLPAVDEYGLQIEQVSEVRHPNIKRLVDESDQTH